MVLIILMVLLLMLLVSVAESRRSGPPPSTPAARPGTQVVQSQVPTAPSPPATPTPAPVQEGWGCGWSLLFALALLMFVSAVAGGSL